MQQYTVRHTKSSSSNVKYNAVVGMAGQARQSQHSAEQDTGRTRQYIRYSATILASQVGAAEADKRATA